MKPCGICAVECSHLGARGQVVVCRTCEAKATTADGRSLVFHEGFKKEDGVLYFMGPGAYYADGDPEAGEECTEIWDKGIWIEGQRVELYEGVAGWMGLIVRQR